MRVPSLRFCLCRVRPLIGLALWISLASQAQPLGDAASSEATSAPLRYQALPASPPLARLPEAGTWQRANEAVAAFPRGHADIAAWEAQQAPRTEPAPTPTHPHAGNARHGGTR